MIRIEAIWLATEPLDMRAGTDTVLARVVKVFGAARPHHAYLFTNKRAPDGRLAMYDFGNVIDVSLEERQRLKELICLLLVGTGIVTVVQGWQA